MKTILFFLLTGIIYLNTYSQIDFQEHIIDIAGHWSFLIHAVDIDGDSDKDVLSLLATPGVVWYENTDGQGSFGFQQNIFMEDFISSIYPEDMDSDGDIDILIATHAETEMIGWCENIDGQGTFSGLQIIDSPTDPHGVFATDIDGDGDKDVLSSYEDSIVWYENIDGQGTFGEQQIIGTHITGNSNVYSADIDSDGDMDVLSSYEDSIVWHENLDGQGTFGEQIIITLSAFGVSDVNAADLDSDNDVDLISVFNDNNTIVWYENLNSQGNFVVHIITTLAEGALQVDSADLDKDGDLDVISTTFNTNTFEGSIAWYENLDGQGNFEVRQIISSNTDGKVAACTEDLDGDSDIDVLTSSISFQGNDKIFWYENLGKLGAGEYFSQEFHLYPNPTTGILNINSETTITQIEIYNQLGQLVVSNKDQNTIDISSVDQGVYFVKVMDENGNISTKKVVKK